MAVVFPRALAILTVSAALAGCVTVQVGTPQAAFEVVQAVSASGVPASSVGPFQKGPDLSDEADKSLGVRAETLVPPQARTFSAYLGDLLKADLASAGKLDPQSTTVISGHLDQNELHAGSLDINSGHISATFVVTRNGKEIFSKAYDASASWNSAYLGAIAIPEAINRYTSLYKDLLRQLFADEAFRSAIRQGATL